MVKASTFTMTLKSVFHVKQNSVLRFCQQHRAVGFKGQAEHTVAAEECLMRQCVFGERGVPGKGEGDDFLTRVDHREAVIVRCAAGKGQHAPLRGMVDDRAALQRLVRAAQRAAAGSSAGVPHLRVPRGKCRG